MSLKNSVRLIGHLGMDPDGRVLTGEKKISRFSIATSETYLNQEGAKTTETQWHSIVVWGKQADFVQKYLKKGQEIALEGKLISRSYIDKENMKRFVTEIICTEILLLGKKS